MIPASTSPPCRRAQCRHNLDIGPIADDGTADLTFTPEVQVCDPLFRHEPLVAADISDTTEKE